MPADAKSPDLVTRPLASGDWPLIETCCWRSASCQCMRQRGVADCTCARWTDAGRDGA